MDALKVIQLLHSALAAVCETRDIAAEIVGVTYDGDHKSGSLVITTDDDTDSKVQDWYLSSATLQELK